MCSLYLSKFIKYFIYFVIFETALIVIKQILQLIFINFSNTVIKSIHFENSCDLFTSKKHSSVTIDREIYPKYVSLHQNISINFPCLNQNCTNVKLKHTYYGTVWMEFELKTIKKNPYLTIDFLIYPFNKCGLTVNRSLANESAIKVFHLNHSFKKFFICKPSNQK